MAEIFPVTMVKLNQNLEILRESSDLLADLSFELKLQ